LGSGIKKIRDKEEEYSIGQMDQNIKDSG